MVARPPEEGNAVSYSRRQADKILGWGPRRRKAYWKAQMAACSQFGDEGECLAQVAKHIPVDIAGVGLGSTLSDMQSALRVTAGLFTNPDETLKRYAPPIVTAADNRIVTPLLGKVGQAIVPYMLKYVMPVMAGLYVTTGIAAYYSYKTYHRKSVRPNRRRRTSRSR